MAKKLDSFKFTGTASGVYTWDKWLDGNIWELTHGVDFQCAPNSFRTTVNKAASNRNLGVKTAVRGDSVIIQAYS